MVTKYWVGYNNDDHDAKMVLMNWLELIKVFYILGRIRQQKTNTAEKENRPTVVADVFTQQ